MSLVVVALVAYVFGLVGSIPPAGPVAVLVIARGAEGHFGAALRVGVGAAIAEGIYAFVAFFAFAALAAHRGVVLPVTHAITAVVLGAVGGRFLAWRQAPAAAGVPPPERGAFWLGFSICALNPTLLVTWSTATAALYARQWIHVERGLALPFALGATLGVASWISLLVALLRRHGRRFPREAITWAVRGMGLLLVALACWSAVELARLALRHWG